MTQIAGYGSWESPIDAHLLTAGQLGLGGGGFDGERLIWQQSRADEGGRTSLWARIDGVDTELTPDRYVRTMVHEYGGGAWSARDGQVIYSTFPSHLVYLLRDGTHHQLSTDEKLRYADFELHPELGIALAVREDHRESDLDCINEIVALSLDPDDPLNAEGGRVIASGADFYSSPRLSADGTLAWLEWDHPNMPWDATRLMVGSYRDGQLSEVRQIAGTDTSAPCYPAWHGNQLFFLDDASGFWNFYRFDGAGVQRLHEDDHDYCYPAWVFGSAYQVLDDGRILATRVVDGEMRLGTLGDGQWTPTPGLDACSVAIGGTQGTSAVVVASYPDRYAELGVLDVDSGQLDVVRRASDIAIDPGYVSVPEARTWQGPQGEVHAWYYPPANKDFAAPDGDLPPLKVLSHGGPTGMASNAFVLAKQYWTSRGWAILDVNYGGSAGYGRDYRNRLQGQWGVVDVTDCADGATAMIEAGLAHPDKIAIEGGSAGGYTTLQALTSSDRFTAGNCLFGLAELTVFCDDTHKFESRYLFGLIGGTPQEKPELFKERSPIFHLDRLSCPMLIQQGADDRIVPPNQAELMADAVRAKRLPVALLMFEGEGHGWRKAETIIASTEAANSFFAQVFGHEAVGVPKLPIENL